MLLNMENMTQTSTTPTAPLYDDDNNSDNNSNNEDSNNNNDNKYSDNAPISTTGE